MSQREDTRLVVVTAGRFGWISFAPVRDRECTKSGSLAACMLVIESADATETQVMGMLVTVWYIFCF